MSKKGIIIYSLSLAEVRLKNYYCSSLGSKRLATDVYFQLVDIVYLCFPVHEHIPVRLIYKFWVFNIQCWFNKTRQC